MATLPLPPRTMAGRRDKVSSRRQQFIKETRHIITKFHPRPVLFHGGAKSIWARMRDALARTLARAHSHSSRAAQGHKALLLRSFFPHFNKANSGEL
jgi:hypothetical protein